MVRVTDMTHGRPIRLILLFSLPLMLGSVFQQLYTIVDTIIIGRGVGMQALASIGAADWINWLVLWGLQGFTQGFAILVAQEFGAGAYDRLLSAARQLLVDETLSVTQISQHLGFEYPQHFVRFFKAQTGKTPSEYRKTA